MNDQLQDISLGELEGVVGGRGGFLDNFYRSIVNHFGAQIGGKKLAETLYGRRTTDADRARAQAAMKKFLVAGNKLPKGVPNIFG